MSAATPRRSLRLPHTHTPKMSERKKSLFLTEAEAEKESLTRHRRLSVVNSESDSDDFDLGIISALDASSCDENDQTPHTPERPWRETRSHTKKFQESQDLKNFMKSPFTLKKYQTQHPCPDTKCSSTPATPHLQYHPGTPSSSHSCASVNTTSSTSSKARKSLASLIADTESCSSSLKDLNFDSDSGADSKENTPSKSLRRSTRYRTPKHSFKGILVEQKENMYCNKLASPMLVDPVLASPLKNAVICLTKIDMNSTISPTQMMKTPHNTTESKTSPPKLGHSRRSAVEVQESPESNCSEKSHKRLHYEGMSDSGIASKHPRLDPAAAPKARLSLFNSDRLKEILSAKSFYGKSNPELNTNIASKLCTAIETTSARRRPFSQSHRRKRKPGQINMGVRHRIRKPRAHKRLYQPKSAPLSASVEETLNKSAATNTSKDASMVSQNSTIIQDDKADPFVKEQQTIEALLSQWTEEELPESELVRKPPELACFNSTVIEETRGIFQPVTATPVAVETYTPNTESVIVELGVPPVAAETYKPNTESVIVELGASVEKDVVMDGAPKGEFLPAEGGYLVVDGEIVHGQKIIPDLDEIERELRMLDEEIMQMAQSNNLDAGAVLAATDAQSCGSTEPCGSSEEPCVSNVEPKGEPSTSEESEAKVFSIFSKPNSGLSTPTSKGASEQSKRCLLKSGSDQYVIDAGQKKFGATQCPECGVIYQIGDPQDEHDHLIHHNATDVLQFNGWKEECVVGVWGAGRCIRVRGGGAGWRRVCTLLQRVVHPQLGVCELPREPHVYTAYLYVEKKQIIGCAVLEPKTRAYKMIPDQPNCCSVEDYAVKCGVSRVWTHARWRRRGVARRLLECARASVLYGQALRTDELAFSSPTPAGAALAATYCGVQDFYVYLD